VSPTDKVKVLKIDANDDSKDLVDHLETYKARMDLQAVPDELMCRAFSITLKGLTRKWFDTLRSGTIDSFNELSKQFLGQFISGRTHRKSCVYLLTIKQREMKTLREYIPRLTEKN
jgi:CRISPR/Cas system CMR-associated protein Cmr1 (group 7 of RAMP superfamily)